MEPTFYGEMLTYIIYLFSKITQKYRYPKIFMHPLPITIPSDQPPNTRNTLDGPTHHGTIPLL